MKKNDRQEIFLLLQRGYSQREVAVALGKSPSTISREVRRNSVDDTYEPEKAQHKAYVRWKYRKPYAKKIREHPELEAYIRKQLPKGWSPEQIAGRWNQQQQGVNISPYSIYKYIYSDFGGELWRCLERKRKKPRKKAAKREKRALIPNRIPLSQRPEIVEKRERLGDYESDLVLSPHGDKTVVLTGIERKSRFFLAKKLKDKRPARVIRSLKAALKNSPLETVTFDNGLEFSHHEKLGCNTFFCAPYSSWEKGSVEYGNRLLRRFFPKGTRFSQISSAALAAAVRSINNTPRKCLNFKTPAEVFFDSQKNPP